MKVELFIVQKRDTYYVSKAILPPDFLLYYASYVFVNLTLKNILQRVMVLLLKLYCR